MTNLHLLLRLLEVVFIIFTAISVTMVLARFSRYSHWSVRMFDFPVKQVAIIHTCLTLLIFVFKDYGVNPLSDFWIVLSVVVIGFLLFSIWPYTPLHTKDLQKTDNQHAGQSISLMVANVYMENTDHASLLARVRAHNPDCILLLETDLKWATAMKELHSSYPYKIQYPLENTYGLLFFSKYKIHNPEIRFLLKSDIPSIKARLEISPGIFTWFYGVHPEPPSPTESDTYEPGDIELLKLAKEVRQLDEPVICAGDFNDVAWSHTTRLFRRYSGLLDPRIGRGSFSTFHVKYSLLRWPLDHCFLSSHFTINDMRVLPGINSDHFPILINLNMNVDNIHTTARPLLEDVIEIKEKLENEEEHADV